MSRKSEKGREEAQVGKEESVGTLQGEHPTDDIPHGASIGAMLLLCMQNRKRNATSKAYDSNDGTHLSLRLKWLPPSFSFGGHST
jgi:hypothetical protein